MVVGWTLFAVLAGRPAAAAETGTTAVPVQRPRAMLVAPDAPTVVAPVAPQPELAPSPAPSAPVAAPTTPAEASTAPANGPTLPPAREVAAARAQPGSNGNDPAIHRASAPQRMGKFSHRGFTTDLRIGTIGCLRGACAGNRHNTSPGFRIDGFLGGNIKGWVDLGVAGGWGTLGSDVTPGTNVLSLYGLDPYQLQTALGLLAGQALGIDFGALTVNDTKLRTAQVGPLLRVHFIPRGRFAAYVGSGVQYNLFRAKYSTPAGPTRLDFHGLAVPIEAGFGVHVIENLALGVQFDYLWTWYAIANLDQGQTSLPLPVRVLDEAARSQTGQSFRDQLPQFWTFALTLRARI